MPITAVPPHLQKNDYKAIGTGMDWDVYGLRHIPQHWMAFGPNATEKIGWLTILPVPYWFAWYEIDVKLFGRHYTFDIPEPVKWTRLVFPIPVPARWRKHPVLILGKGMTRWESTQAKSILFVAPFAEGFQTQLPLPSWLRKLLHLGRRNHLPATEMNPSHVDYNNPLLLDGLKPETSLSSYSPSTIQYWSRFSFGICWPLAFQIRWNWGGRDPNTGKQRKSFQFRCGARHDALDDYFDCPTLSAGEGN